MTKWDYMVVIVEWEQGVGITSVTYNGRGNRPKKKWLHHKRHKALKEFGEAGWELIKIIGDRSKSPELLYFKRPL